MNSVRPRRGSNSQPTNSKSYSSVSIASTGVNIAYFNRENYGKSVYSLYNFYSVLFHLHTHYTQKGKATHRFGSPRRETAGEANGGTGVRPRLWKVAIAEIRL